ncbi:MAG TPA: CerR family C-terminal domain-containing protein [Vicinamibacterales bacterium]|nr:CerR family C-terminal domain-containing protein [Vicinamibacterales bacterium]
MKARAAVDAGTRARILASATRLFAARGFEHVTIRDICRDARANVAAVNYHFRGKVGLYTEVLEAAADLVRSVTRAAIDAGEGQTPEGKLRAYVRVHLERMFAMRHAAWLGQLIHREIHEPTAGLDDLIDRLLHRALKPRFEYLGTIVAALVGRPVRDPRVVQCTVSIHAQVVMFRPNPLIDRLPRKDRRAFAVHGAIEHVTAFSLAGVDAYRRRVRHRAPAASRTRRRPRAA